MNVTLQGGRILEDGSIETRAFIKRNVNIEVD